MQQSPLRYTDLGHRTPHQILTSFLQDQLRGRRFRYLAGTDSIDRLFLSLSCLSLPRDGNLRGKTERNRERKKYAERTEGWDSIIFSSMEWKSFYFLFRKKVVPYETFHSWSTAVGKLVLCLLHSCVPQFYFILMFPFSYLLFSAGMGTEVMNHSELYRITRGIFDQDVGDFSCSISKKQVSEVEMISSLSGEE